jgi:hypothetical protein
MQESEGKNRVFGNLGRFFQRNENRLFERQVCVDYSEPMMSSRVTPLAAATARKMALSVPMRSGL